MTPRLISQSILETTSSFKTIIPGAASRDEWQSMGSSLQAAPHRAVFKYECNSNQLILTKDILPGAGVANYKDVFSRL